MAVGGFLFRDGKGMRQVTLVRVETAAFAPRQQLPKAGPGACFRACNWFDVSWLTHSAQNGSKALCGKSRLLDGSPQSPSRKAPRVVLPLEQTKGALLFVKGQVPLPDEIASTVSGQGFLSPLRTRFCCSHQQFRAHNSCISLVSAPPGPVSPQILGRQVPAAGHQWHTIGTH